MGGSTGSQGFKKFYLWFFFTSKSNLQMQISSIWFEYSFTGEGVSKLMRHTLEPLRKMGLSFSFYLDDICVLAKAKKQMMSRAQQMIQHSEKLEAFNQQKEEYIVFDQVIIISRFPIQRSLYIGSSAKYENPKLETGIRQLLKTIKFLLAGG